MWSHSRPMRPLSTLTATPAAQLIQAILHEHDGWIARLTAKYGLPRAVLLRMLDRPGALEDEIAAFLIERATDHARNLFASNQAAPTGDDLYSRAVRGVLTRLIAARDAAFEAERQKRYAETDELIRRMKAGQIDE